MRSPAVHITGSACQTKNEDDFPNAKRNILRVGGELNADDAVGGVVLWAASAAALRSGEAERDKASRQKTDIMANYADRYRHFKEVLHIVDRVLPEHV